MNNKVDNRVTAFVGLLYLIKAAFVEQPGKASIVSPHPVCTSCTTNEHANLWIREAASAWVSWMHEYLFSPTLRDWLE